MSITDQISSFWTGLPNPVRFILYCHLGLLIVSTIRFSKLARHLYRFSWRPILVEDIIKGETDPDLLVVGALAHRLPFAVSFASGADEPGFSPGNNALKILETAEHRLGYFWDSYSADVVSARRASFVAFLLSLIMVALGASPIFLDCWASSKEAPGFTCLLRSVWDLLALLAIGWSFSGALYVSSSFFERALALRRNRWRYFLAQVKVSISGG